MKTAKRTTENNSRTGFTASTSAQFKGGIVCKLYNKKGDLTRVSDCPCKELAMRTQLAQRSGCRDERRCEAGPSAFFIVKKTPSDSIVSAVFAKGRKVKDLRLAGCERSNWQRAISFGASAPFIDSRSKLLRNRRQDAGELLLALFLFRCLGERHGAVLDQNL
ncbi:MAG: hypothetical protein WCE73_04145, partial [Candidatus Angelobacter sp.]